MSGRNDDRRPVRSGSDTARGSRGGRDAPQGRPGARGAGKSYSEMRYQAGRGGGRGARGSDRSDNSRGGDRSDSTRGGDRADSSRGGDRADSTRGNDRSDNREKSGKHATGQGDSNVGKSPASKSDSGKGGPAPLPSAPSAADLEAKWQKEEEERLRQEREKLEEEERKKREEEEEIKRKEEEERQKEEDKKRKEAEDKKSIEDFAADCALRISEKMKLKEKNLNAEESRPEERFFSKLDSSLKKNTAFVKKLKLLTESQKDSLTKEFNGLNLTKYVGEVAASITEAKLKMSDISCAVHICSIMHQRYADFAQSLLESWQKYFPTKKDEKISNPSKYRVDLRFFAELVAVGVFRDKEGLPLLANQLAILINNDKEEHNNLSILTSFCKHCGDDYAGLLPRKLRCLAERFEVEVPRSKVLPKERQKGCRNLLGEYYNALCKHIVADHKNLKNMEKQNRKTLLTKGELSTERKEKYEEFYNNYQKLFSNSQVFTDLLDEDMPELPEDDPQDDDGGLDIFNPLKNLEFQYEGDTSLWEDEETRTLYETLPDLKASIPGILYKESESGSKDEVKETEAETALEDDMENLDIEDVEREMETQQQLAEEQTKDDTKTADDSKDEEAVVEQLLPPVVEEFLVKTKKNDDETGSLMKMQFEAYAQSLPTCVNRDLIDKAAIEFCMNFNTKNNRKKLVRALFTVHRTRYDLLPFYSRLTATLYPCMPDVANDLVQLLKGDFRWHVRKKDQINIESKLKTVRFIGELVKFKLFPKSEALHCLKMLLFDFTHHNIEMVCALLESSGRYLYRSPDSHHRTRVYLELMMRKKSALLMDSRYCTMIENAYYYSNPPDTPQVVRKVRPPMHEYIRKLLYKDLSKVTTEKVLRQTRKLNWDDPEIAFYTTKCLIAVWNIRFNSVHCAANLLAGIAPYHETVAIQVVDGVLEDIRLGMEINHPKYNQRRVSCAKYLGELYNYRMVESAVIFKTLYSFITFGVSNHENEISVLDPPDHLFRIRSVCVVLETCGQYFDKGSSKKKLDCFLVYFQRYYWYKKGSPIWNENRPFPIDIENLMQDTLEAVRPKLKMFQNFEEACKACEDLENEFKSKIAAILPMVENEEGMVSETDDGGLTTIQESDEISDASQQDKKKMEEDESENSQNSQSQSQSQSDLTGSQSRQEDEHSGSEGEEYEDDADDEYIDTDHDLDEDQVIVKSNMKHVECQEDDDFMAAFDKMLEDTSKARNNESIKVPQFDVPVPVNLKGSKKKFELNPEPMLDNTIKFTLITRRGNKQQFSDLNVPVTAEFATKFKEREEAERVEKERMKQVVLDIHERQEEEDYQEMLASLNRPMLVNNNRERRVRYQHPKGAPDADEIFGSKIQAGFYLLSQKIHDAAVKYGELDSKVSLQHATEDEGNLVNAMGQEVSVYTENLPNIAVVPNFQHVLPHLQRLKPKLRFSRDGFDIERELRKWLSLSKAGEHTDHDKDEGENEGTDEVHVCHLRLYEHYRTHIGSPSINRRSFTEDEIDRFIKENDGFPLPSTDEEIKAFDQQAFIDQSQSWGKGGTVKRTKKRDRQRSKSATSVPDLGTIRLKLQKLQSPGKPKFIEHLINRVISKRVSRRNSNGLTNASEEPVEVPAEPLSPDSEKCLQQAEAIVEELLSCSNRPASGESTDSGKGSSLLESTSDFSPTSKRRSWSTPASPTFHGIVKERLRSFQVLNESNDTDSVSSQAGIHSPLIKQKSFRNEEFDQEIKDINKSIKQFYCSASQDESFNSAVMECGYVKALVAKINENKFKPDTESAEKHEENENTENGELVNDDLKLGVHKEDSGWSEWDQEVGGNEGQEKESDVATLLPKKTSDSVDGVDLRSKRTSQTDSHRTSYSSSGSSSPRQNSRTNSVSDSDCHEEEEKPKDRLHQIAHELLTTERAYVARLNLLDQVFHFRVTMENKSGNFLPQEAVTQMFSNIKPIYLFHKDFLLPQLEDRMQNWSDAQKIGDVMAKLAPFLKIYTEYVKNYDKAMAMIDKWTSQSPRFAALLQEIQQRPECGQLTLQHHMLEPIQRVPRYEMLLKDYLKRLEPDSTDRPDAQKALGLVTEAASHSNTAMKKLDKFHKLLNIIPRLNGEGTNDLVSPTRELVKEGPITKISARSGEKQARYIFLFNDLLLVCSEQMMGSYKLRARLSVEGMEITAGDNQTVQNTFCVKCIEKTVEFLDEANNGQGLDWFATFQQVVTDYHHKSKLCRVRSTEPGDQPNSAVDGHPDMASISYGLSTVLPTGTPTTTARPGSQLGLKSPQWVKDEEVTMCMACQDKFTAIKRRHHCRACGKVFCAKCSSRKAQLAYDNNQLNRVCQRCYDLLKKGSVSSLEMSNDSTPTSPKPAVQIHKADEMSVLSGYLNVMDRDHKWTKKWIALHDDFAMYFYKKHKDVAAIQTLPLPGHNVKVIGDSADRPNVFSLTHKDVSVCYFQADSDLQFQQWVRVLEKLVILQLPSEEEKRLSTQSDSSGQSNSSGSSGLSSQS